MKIMFVPDILASLQKSMNTEEKDIDWSTLNNDTIGDPKFGLSIKDKRLIIDMNYYMNVWLLGRYGEYDDDKNHRAPTSESVLIGTVESLNLDNFEDDTPFTIVTTPFDDAIVIEFKISSFKFYRELCNEDKVRFINSLNGHINMKDLVYLSISRSLLGGCRNEKTEVHLSQ